MIVRWRKGRAYRATEKLSVVSTVQMPAKRVPVIVNAVTPIVSDTQGMVTVVAVPCLSFLCSLVATVFCGYRYHSR